MSDLRNILEEEYAKRPRTVTPTALMEMIQEIMSVKLPVVTEENSPASQRRSRLLRLPVQFPTEISVGQTPGDPDRQVFETWMNRIVPEGDLAAKIKSIESYIDNPPELPVADTLSYLMFLNTFAFMLQEFNASVAGFLWEPFLAALFGAQSVQVPTSEHDIADVKLQISRGAGLERVSLKILREKGAVGGSFVDLVRHFAANPDQPMVYVVIKKLEGDTKMKFFEFPVSQATFFDFIGHPKLQTTLEPAEPQTFALPEPMSAGAAKKFVKQNLGRGWQVEKVTTPGNAEPLRGRLEAETEYEAHILQPIQVAPRAGVGRKLSSNAKHLWGPEEEYSQWYGLYQQMQQGGIAPTEFWSAVMGQRPELTPWAPEGAKGFHGAQQFEIAWNVLEGSELVDHLGTLDISKEALDKAFASGSQAIGTDLTDLFNAMTDLVDDVGRFFLIDCGDPAGEAKKCTPEDEKTRTQSGVEAVQEANLIQRVVNEKIASQIQQEDK